MNAAACPRGAPSADVFMVVPVYMKDTQDIAVAGTSLSAPLAAGVVALPQNVTPPSRSLLVDGGGSLLMIKKLLLDKR